MYDASEIKETWAWVARHLPSSNVFVHVQQCAVLYIQTQKLCEVTSMWNTLVVNILSRQILLILFNCIMLYEKTLFKCVIAYHIAYTITSQHYSQQDAQEILIYLLEGLHEDLNRCKRKKKRVIDCDDGVVTTPAAQLAEMAWKHYIDVDDSMIVGEQGFLLC